MSDSDTTLERELLLRTFGERGIGIGPTPSPYEDAMIPGVLPRDQWRSDAREVYGDFEELLAKRYAAASPSANVIRSRLVSRPDAPASWWNHVKLALRERWPRLFGWLRVRWGRHAEAPL